MGPHALVFSATATGGTVDANFNADFWLAVVTVAPILFIAYVQTVAGALAESAKAAGWDTTVVWYVTITFFVLPFITIMGPEIFGLVSLDVRRDYFVKPGIAILSLTSGAFLITYYAALIVLGQRVKEGPRRPTVASSAHAGEVKTEGVVAADAGHGESTGLLRRIVRLFMPKRRN